MYILCWQEERRGYAAKMNLESGYTVEHVGVTHRDVELRDRQGPSVTPCSLALSHVYSRAQSLSYEMLMNITAKFQRLELD